MPSILYWVPFSFKFSISLIPLSPSHRRQIDYCMPLNCCNYLSKGDSKLATYLWRFDFDMLSPIWLRRAYNKITNLTTSIGNNYWQQQLVIILIMIHELLLFCVMSMSDHSAAVSVNIFISRNSTGPIRQNRRNWDYIKQESTNISVWNLLVPCGAW